jgi:TrmH family RNA methyltransferase
MSDSLHSLVRDLRLRRGRERRGLALAEGVRLVEEALAAGVTIQRVLAGPALEATARGRGLKAALRQAGHRIETVSEKVFDGLAATEHSQGILAVVKPRSWQLGELHVSPRHPVLVLDAVQDPGNVGTLVRTAFALDAAGVLALPGTAELGNPKTLRATMGAAFHAPYVTASEAGFREWADRAGVRVWLAEAGDGNAAPSELRVSRAPLALVVGNEGAGIRPSLRDWAAGLVSVPLAQGSESLNVGVAAGILLYEATRE